jgi:hypothetical protein
MSYTLKVSHGNKFPVAHTLIREVKTLDAIRRWVDRLRGTEKDAQILIETGRVDIGTEVVVMEQEVAK